MQVPGTRAIRLTGLALVVPVLGFVEYGSTGRDDAYITYWAADRLRASGSIVNVNGDRLEQSTSLLHTLVLALTSWVTRVDVPRVGLVLGIVCGALTTLVAYALGKRLHPRGGIPAALIVGTLGPLVYWSFSGLETSLSALALALAMLTIMRIVESWPERRVRDVVAAICSIGAVVTVRPEYGIALTISLALAAVLIVALPRLGVAKHANAPSRPVAQVLLAAAGITAAMTVALMLARLAYFGSLFPRPVIAKQGHDATSDAFRALAHPGSSTSYIRTTLVQSGTFIALAAALGGIILGIRSIRPAAILIGATVVVGLVAVAVSGGDWMEAGRLVAPWLMLAAVLAGAAVASIPRPSMIAVATGVLVAANLLGNANYARTSSTGLRLWQRHENPETASGVAFDGHPWEERWNVIHRRDLAFLYAGTDAMRALIEVAPSRPRVASSQAGMVPYYLKRQFGQRFEFVDMAGITTKQLDPCQHGIKSGTLGRQFGLRQWRVRQKTCGPLPDAVFGLGSQSELTKGAVRYVVLFTAALPNPKYQGGCTNGQWMAVRTNLAKAVRARLDARGWPRQPPECLEAVTRR